VAGRKLLVDWAGDAIAVFDPIMGAEHGARIFVAALGASNYTYAEARWTETLPDWIGAHENALSAIGGVPKAAVCDNLKASITKPSRVSFVRAKSRHVGFALIVARQPRARDFPASS
jgi:transposase